MSDDETEEGPVAESWSPQDAGPAPGGAPARFDETDAANIRVLVGDLGERRDKAYQRYLAYTRSPEHGPMHEYTIQAYEEIRECDRALAELRRLGPQIEEGRGS